MDCPKDIPKDRGFLWNLLQQKKILAMKPKVEHLVAWVLSSWICVVMIFLRTTSLLIWGGLKKPAILCVTIKGLAQTN